MGDASPKFMKQRALRKQAEDGYSVLTISAEEIQSIADDAAESQFEESHTEDYEMPDPGESEESLS
ncbi:hypothetical protein D3C77_592340 [compost metagenome]